MAVFDVDESTRRVADPRGLRSGADGRVPVGLLSVAGVRSDRILREQHVQFGLEAVFADPALYSSGEAAYHPHAHPVGLARLLQTATTMTRLHVSPVRCLSLEALRTPAVLANHLSLLQLLHRSHASASQQSVVVFESPVVHTAERPEQAQVELPPHPPLLAKALHRRVHARQLRQVGRRAVVRHTAPHVPIQSSHQLLAVPDRLLDVLQLHAQSLGFKRVAGVAGVVADGVVVGQHEAPRRAVAGL